MISLNLHRSTRRTKLITWEVKASSVSCATSPLKQNSSFRGTTKRGTEKSESNGTATPQQQRGAEVTAKIQIQEPVVRNGVQSISSSKRPTPSTSAKNVVSNGKSYGTGTPTTTPNGTSSNVNSSNNGVRNLGLTTPKVYRKDPFIVLEKTLIRSEKCFICRHCGDTLLSSEEHQAHEKSHLGGKGYKCLLCQQSFEAEVTLAWHKRTRHRNEPTVVKNYQQETPRKEEEKVEEIKPEPELLKLEPEPEVLSSPAPPPSAPPEQNGQEEPIPIITPLPNPPAAAVKPISRFISRIKKSEVVNVRKSVGGRNKVEVVTEAVTLVDEPIIIVAEPIKKVNKRRESTRSTQSAGTATNADVITFTCRYCGDLFINTGSHEIHETSHLGGKGFRCLLCEQSFEGEDSLGWHKRTRHRNEPVKIEQPEAPKAAAAEEETIEESSEKPDDQELLSIPIKNDVMEVEEEEISPPPPPPLPSKSPRVTSKRRRKTMEVKQPELSRSNIDKDEESKELSRTEEIPPESGNFVCRFCGDRFPSSGSQENHEEMHVGGKGFKCLLCEQSFEAEVKLTWHHRTRHRDRSSCSNNTANNKNPEKEDKDKVQPNPPLKRMKIKKMANTPAEAPARNGVIIPAVVQRAAKIRRKKVLLAKRKGPKMKITGVSGHHSTLPPRSRVSVPARNVPAKMEEILTSQPTSLENSESDTSSTLTQNPEMVQCDVPVQFPQAASPVVVAPPRPKPPGRYIRSSNYLKCQQCPRRCFRSKYDLSVHILRIHTSDEQRPYRCTVPNCGKGFVTRFELSRHVDPCRKNFALGIPKRNPPQKKMSTSDGDDGRLQQQNQQARKSNESEVTTRSPTKAAGRFKCRYCGDTFSASGSHLLHEESHKGGKGFQCLLCDQSFEKEFNLTCHRRTRHRSIQSTGETEAEEEEEQQPAAVLSTPSLTLVTPVSPTPIMSPPPPPKRESSPALPQLTLVPMEVDIPILEPVVPSPTKNSVEPSPSPRKSHSSPITLPISPVKVAPPPPPVPVPSSLVPRTKLKPIRPAKKILNPEEVRPRVVTIGPHKCRYCNNGYPTELAVAKHILRVHTSHDDKPFHCPLPDCGRGYATRAEYNRHVKVSRCAPLIQAMGEIPPPIPLHGKKKKKKKKKLLVDPELVANNVTNMVATGQGEEAEEGSEGLHICTQCPFTRLFHSESDLSDHIRVVHTTLEGETEVEAIVGTPCLGMVTSQPRLVLNSFVDETTSDSEAGPSSKINSAASSKKGVYACIKCDTWYSYECDLWLHNKNNHADDPTAPTCRASQDALTGEGVSKSAGLVVARKSSVGTPPPTPTGSSLVLVNGVQTSEHNDDSNEKLIGTVEVDFSDVDVTFVEPLQLQEVVFDENGVEQVQETATTSDNFSIYFDNLLPVEPSSLMCEADQLFLDEDCRRDLIPI